MEQHQIAYNLKQIFDGLKGFRSATYESGDLRDYTIFGKYLELSVGPETKCIPIFNGYGVAQAFLSRNSSRVVIPLIVTGHGFRRREYGTVIRDCFGQTGTSGICKVVTSKGDIYYGAPGVLLDKDLQPLFLAFYNLERVVPTFASEGIWRVAGITIKISPNVFLEADKLLEKSLVNKIIPFYLSGPISVDADEFGIGEFFPKIVIEDLSNYIKAPSEPQNSEDMNEVLNDFLVSRTDEDVSAFHNE